MIDLRGAREESDQPLERIASESFAPRLATTMNILIVVGVLFVQVINVSTLTELRSGATITDGELALCYVAVGVLFVLQAMHSGLLPLPRSAALVATTLGLQAVLSYAPTLYIGEMWGGAAGFFLGSIMLLVRPQKVALAAVFVFLTLTGVIAVANGYDFRDTSYLVVANILDSLAIYSVSRLATFVRQLHAARRELAQLAVEEERTRFSRDLHDLIGYSLTAITLKGELAYQQVDGEPEGAKQDLTSLLSISRVALQDVRSVARSYRQLPLDAQLQSARSVLASAGIEVEVTGSVQLSGLLETVLATVVREGVTNLMRHSKAEHCAMTLAEGADLVTLTVANDGVDEGWAATHAGRDLIGEHAVGDGLGGLTNLRERVEKIGGTLTATADEHGWFWLAATVPARMSRAANQLVPADLLD